jgi:hypothetical protein
MMTSSSSSVTADDVTYLRRNVLEARASLVDRVSDPVAVGGFEPGGGNVTGFRNPVA